MPAYSFSSCLLDVVSWVTLLSRAFILAASLCCSSWEVWGRAKNNGEEGREREEGVRILP